MSKLELLKKTDRRTKYTKQVIKDSLLEVLKKKPYSKITVTEICQIADINRGTFYLHYYDLDDVVDEMLREMLDDTTQVLDHVMSTKKGCSAKCTYPFCDKIQNSKHYHPFFLDDTISGRFVDTIADQYKESFVTSLMQGSCLTFEEAEAIFYFQINGCLTINRMMIKNHCRDWKKVQTTIDQFIKSGLDSFFIHNRD